MLADYRRRLTKPHRTMPIDQAANTRLMESRLAACELLFAGLGSPVGLLSAAQIVKFSAKLFSQHHLRSCIPQSTLGETLRAASVTGPFATPFSVT